MTSPQSTTLNERTQSVLNWLVSKYIEEGTPVGSRTLARDTDLSLSPATIRNVMSDLESYGLISAPHTSAGRVPTAQGYRFFINSVLKTRPINQQAVENLTDRFDGVTDPNKILSSATELLSQITSFAGIVSTPDSSAVNIRQIEFLKLSEQRVLAILVTEDGQVQNKVLSAHREYSETELVEAANYFNAEYSTKSLDGVRAQLADHMTRDRSSMHREMRTVVNMAGQFFSDDTVNKDNVLVSGENNLLAIPEFGELDKLRSLFDTLKTKQVLFDLLQKSMYTEGVNIFIGEESGYESFRDCSVIAAPYHVDNKRVGVLGVIGPTRMQYEEVISAVDVTAKLVGSALSSH